MSLLNALKQETNFTTTENGGITHKTSNSKVLDYFSQASALRNRSFDDIISLVENSLAEDKLLTIKVLFNSRDIRNGQGERETFRKILNYLAIHHTELIEKNISFISEFGRWDDIFALYNTPLEDKAILLIKNQLKSDLTTDKPSLCAKWLPSENASSKRTRDLAVKTANKLGMSHKQYRKTLSNLRKKIDIVETKVTEKNYSAIEYDKLPSQANMKYKAAFFRNDEERYIDFINKLQKGETSINVGTLLPYQLVKKALDKKYSISKEERNLLNSMWESLPDYINEDSGDTLAVVDVSGSMAGTPMEMAISLGLYLAEKNTGAFRNHFITFETNPHLVEVKGTDFFSKVKNISDASWGGSTNIEKTFDLILNTALKHNLPQSELPERVVIISDMEFDEIEGWSWNRANKTNFQVIEEKFKQHDYVLPRLVFWNVDARNNNIPMTMKDNVQLVSGPSPILFEQILKDLSAYDLMLEILNKKIYDCITI